MVSNTKYYIKEYYSKSYEGGTKARLDTERFLQQNGFEAIDLKLSKNVLIRPALAKLAILKFLIKAPKHSSIVFQFYPFFGRLNMVLAYLFFYSAKWFKSAKLIPIVHDLNGIRIDDKKVLAKEKRLLRLAHTIICLNSEMEGTLKELGFHQKKISLSLWDYHLDRTVTKNREPKRSIVFAGNLFKSGFLYRLKELEGNINFNIYGLNFDKSQANGSNCIDYRGILNPDDIAYEMEGSFGLIWDGKELDTCEGHFGNYLRLNSPHKASLYIVSELPVIVWKEAAIAKLVEEKGIGICVNSLHELDQKLGNISNEDYLKMVTNTRKMKLKLMSGYFLKRALEKVT